MHQEAILFKALSDTTRLRLAVLLAIRGETCVCDLAEALAEPDFKISRHLGILRSVGLVVARREGTWMYYKLARPRSALEDGLQMLFGDRFSTHPTAQEDLARLESAIEKRAGGTCTVARSSADPSET